MELLDQTLNFLFYAFSFIVVLSIIVFIHEFGHYWVAKKCGVHIEEFAIGFGKELYGWNDSTGTRWKICLLPLGGYVRMFGDENAASTPDDEKLTKLTKDEQKKAFAFKNVYQRFAIVIAGPMANFILTIVILFGINIFNGGTIVPPIIDKVLENSPAQAAGLKSGDLITNIGDAEISSFNDIRDAIILNSDENLTITYIRNKTQKQTVITPKMHEGEDQFGYKQKRAQIGIKGLDLDDPRIKYVELSFSESITKAVGDTYKFCTRTLTALGQIFTGKRGTEDIGGPARIGAYVGGAMDSFVKNIKCILFGSDTCQEGYVGGIILLFTMTALISANLGLINLFPIPMLDGGHLAYYLYEMVRGKPLNPKWQEYGFKFGFFVLISLMIFAFFNDGRFFGLY